MLHPKSHVSFSTLGIHICVLVGYEVLYHVVLGGHSQDEGCREEPTENLAPHVCARYVAVSSCVVPVEAHS